jgi:hypothetical protein
MAEREVKQTLVSYLDEEGIRRYGLAGETVSVHGDDLERFDQDNGDATDLVDNIHKVERPSGTSESEDTPAPKKKARPKT